MEPTFWAASCTASASVISIMRGTKSLPNSICKRSASACLRTEPNTRNPFEISTFVVPQPIPVETPVTTTSLLFAIAFPLRWITVHLQYLQWAGAHLSDNVRVRHLFRGCPVLALFARAGSDSADTTFVLLHKPRCACVRGSRPLQTAQRTGHHLFSPFEPKLMYNSPRPKSSLVWANQSCRTDCDFDPQLVKECK